MIEIILLTIFAIIVIIAVMPYVDKIYYEIYIMSTLILLVSSFFLLILIYFNVTDLKEELSFRKEFEIYEKTYTNARMVCTDDNCYKEVEMCNKKTNECHFEKESINGK